MLVTPDGRDGPTLSGFVTVGVADAFGVAVTVNENTVVEASDLTFTVLAALEAFGLGDEDGDGGDRCQGPPREPTVTVVGIRVPLICFGLRLFDEVWKN